MPNVNENFLSMEETNEDIPYHQSINLFTTVHPVATHMGIIIYEF